MSKKAAKPVTLVETPVVTELEPASAKILLCGTCKHWSHTGASFGQCMLSGRYSSAPMITTDRASCSSWTE